MTEKDAIKLFNDDFLNKETCYVKVGCMEDKFYKVEDIYIHPARVGELENDWLVIVLEGKVIDATWIKEVKQIPKGKKYIITYENDYETVNDYIIAPSAYRACRMFYRFYQALYGLERKKVYQIHKIRNFDDIYFLTEEEVSKHIEWRIEKDKIKKTKV